MKYHVKQQSITKERREKRDDPCLRRKWATPITIRPLGDPVHACFYLRPPSLPPSLPVPPFVDGCLIVGMLARRMGGGNYWV
jgi:hypothetical protein